MTLALIISPYNAPTPEARAANVRLGIALARWAAAQGYTPVGWWCDVDPDAPPADDPETRAAALARSAERARMVGAAGGVAVRPSWVATTAGMDADQWAYRQAATDEHVICVDANALAPYLLPEPVPTVPRAAVQAAVDRIRDCADVLRRQGYEPIGHDNALMHINDHTGVTPSEVQS